MDESCAQWPRYRTWRMHTPPSCFCLSPGCRGCTRHSGEALSFQKPLEILFWNQDNQRWIIWLWCLVDILWQWHLACAVLIPIPLLHRPFVSCLACGSPRPVCLTDIFPSFSSFIQTHSINLVLLNICRPAFFFLQLPTVHLYPRPRAGDVWTLRSFLWTVCQTRIVSRLTRHC